MGGPRRGLAFQVNQQIFGNCFISNKICITDITHILNILLLAPKNDLCKIMYDVILIEFHDQKLSHYLYSCTTVVVKGESIVALFPTNTRQLSLNSPR